MRYQQSQEYQPHHDFSDQVSWGQHRLTTSRKSPPSSPSSRHHPQNPHRPQRPPLPISRAVPSSASSRYYSTSRRQRRAGIPPSPRPTTGVAFGSSHRRARVFCSTRCGPMAMATISRCTRASRCERASSGSATSGCGIPSAEPVFGTGCIWTAVSGGSIGWGGGGGAWDAGGQPCCFFLV